MREIKFRAWDKLNEKICEYGTDEACDFWEDGCDLMGMSFLSCQPNIIWMQYTGLNDKNGKEIYEGDIVLIRHATGNGGKSTKYKTFPCEIVFDEFNSRFTARWPVNSDKYRFRNDGPKTWEVIGNIYENPELLEGTTP